MSNDLTDIFPNNPAHDLAELFEQVSKHMGNLTMTMGKLVNGEPVLQETLDLAFSTTFKFRTALDSIASDLRTIYER